MPWPLFYFLKKIHALPEDAPVLISFLFNQTKTPSTFRERLFLIWKCYQISYFVDSPHMENEIVRVMSAILQGGAGAVVEAGSYKGSSTAKISLAARLARRKFFVFDSFEGLPEHQEVHGKNIFGGDAYFPPGSYHGSLEEVKRNVEKYGDLGVCKFRKGWFEKTMPDFKEEIAVAYVDADLKSSVSTCLKYLYPRLVPTGVLFSQDAHLPWVMNLLNNGKFWQKEIGIKKPNISGLGQKRMVKIEKINP